ncbi:unnamed protein product [Malus baccata var. baccata]
MGLSKEQLLARLKVTLSLSLSLSLSLCIYNVYIYVVFLPVLSVGLGLGRGGLRMAPEEALGEILQVPLGCVMPFSLVNESGRHVSLLLDHKFKSQEWCFFHPLSNDMSISLSTHDLDKFLKSIERDLIFICLMQANPSVGKDQPPDLACFVPSGSTVLPDPPQPATSSEGRVEIQVSVDNKSTASIGTDKQVNGVNVTKTVTDTLYCHYSLVYIQVSEAFETIVHIQLHHGSAASKYNFSLGLFVFLKLEPAKSGSVFHGFCALAVCAG